MSKATRPEEQSVLMRRQGNALVPTDDRSSEAFSKVGSGDVLVWIKKPRNPKFNRYFFAMVGVIFDNQSRYQTKDQLLDAIKIAVGHYDTVISARDSKPYLVLRSISFDNMDEMQFKEFVDRVMDVVAAQIIPNLKPGDLRRELEGFTRENPSPAVGGRQPSAPTRGDRA